MRERNIAIQNGVFINDNYLNFKGIKYPLPCKPTNVTTIGEKVFVNGYEFKNGKWKKTIKAIFHKYF